MFINVFDMLTGSNMPHYSFKRSQKFNTPRTSQARNVNYFVNRKDFPMADLSRLRKIEDAIENEVSFKSLIIFNIKCSIPI